MSSENENISQTDEKDTEDEPQSEEKPENTEEEQVNLQQSEQMEEAKLKAKYPMALRPSGLLQRRLNKGQQKYFDSGDYNMAIEKNKKQQRPVLPAAIVPQQPTGEAIPTPDNLPTRKTSLVQSKLAAGLT